MIRPRFLVAALAVPLLVGACAELPGDGGGEGVTIAQVVPTLGYVTLDTAWAYDTFGDEDLEVDHVQLSGGDPAALAALDSGDVDFAAVGSEAPLQALAEDGGDYTIIYPLMSQMSLELTVSERFLDQAGVSPSDPLEDRLAALEGARFGVSALGGAQERTTKWLAAQAGLDPEEDIEVLNAGPPSALLAGMDNDRIDAFLLTAPNGAIAEESGYGRVLISLGKEIDELRSYYHLVLVTREDYARENPEKVTSVISALNRANRQIAQDPSDVAEKLHAGDYDTVAVDVLEDSIAGLQPGVPANGELTVDGIEEIVDFTAETGETIVGEELDPADGQGDWWTNKYIEDAG